MVFVDTNVLLDVLTDDSEWVDWSVRQLRLQSQLHRLCVSPVVYAELGMALGTLEAVDQTLEEMELQLEAIPRAALFLAGQAFLRYRRDGGSRRTVLPDFFLAAHAAATGATLLTRDPGPCRRHFPTVHIIAPP
jgi:predicted nucleic acid-binding protein